MTTRNKKTAAPANAANKVKTPKVTRTKTSATVDLSTDDDEQTTTELPTTAAPVETPTEAAPEATESLPEAAPETPKKAVASLPDGVDVASLLNPTTGLAILEKLIEQKRVVRKKDGIPFLGVDVTSEKNPRKEIYEPAYNFDVKEKKRGDGFITQSYWPRVLLEYVRILPLLSTPVEPTDAA